MPTNDMLYNKLIRQFPDTGVLLFDHDLRYMIVEGDILEACGYSPELIGQLADTTDLTAEAETAYKAALMGQATIYEVHYEGRIYHHHIVPIFDDDDAIMGGMVVIRDITEQKRKEIRLRQNEQQFRGLFERNNDAVFIITLDGMIYSANQRAIDLFGYSLAELTSSDADLNLLVYKQNSDDEVLDQLLQGISLSMFEREFTRKDGNRFIAEVNLTLTYDLEGKPSHIQCIVRDITERKRIEMQLEENVDRLMMLHQVDAELADRLSMEYVLSMALDAAIRLSGANIGFIGLLDDESVMHIARMVGEYPQSMEETYLRQRKGIIGRVMRTQESEVIFDVHRDPDYVPTHPRTHAQMAIPLVSQERLIGVLNLESTRTDRFSYEVLDFLKLVTARIAVAIDNARLYKQSETQLAQLRDLYAQVSNLEQIKTDMIRIASHDLRNPLSAIMGFIELMDLDLAMLDDVGEMHDHLENMSRAAKRMEKIVNDILSLERIEENAQQLKDEYFDFSKQVENIYREMEGQASLQSRHITLTMPDSSISVRGDPAQLREAIINLINNAIKYTYAGGKISIRLQYSGGKVIFEVEDNGMGIREEHMDKLFQPFYRVDSKDMENIEGTGLGLHLVKKIIERHGGKMLFASEYGRGSKFGFSLPFVGDEF